MSFFKFSLMIVKVAWRNIWRHKIRSLVVVMAVGLGLWAGIFTAAFMYGISAQRMNSVIEAQLSHIQIHHPEFSDNLEPAYFIPEGEAILRTLEADSLVKAVTGRAVATGMIVSPTSGSGVFIKGIEPASEKVVTNFAEKMIEGDMLESEMKNSILVGEKLAEKLKIRLKSKVVLNLQDKDGDIVSAAFRVAGIYKTNSSKYDEAHVFVRKDDLNRLINTTGQIHEIAIILKDDNMVDGYTSTLRGENKTVAVESWKDLAPELDYINRVMDEYLRIFMAIILLAMAFGIINTMLMAVLERVREIGMLMAIGMNKFRIFMMVMLETVFLTFTGVPVGFLLSFTSIRYLSKTGFDLSMFSKGLAAFEIETVVYPTLDMSFYPSLMLMVAVTALLSSLYPAYKALSLNPSESIRTI